MEGTSLPPVRFRLLPYADDMVCAIGSLPLAYPKLAAARETERVESAPGKLHLKSAPRSPVILSRTAVLFAVDSPGDFPMLFVLETKKNGR